MPYATTSDVRAIVKEALDPYATKADVYEALEPYATKADVYEALEPYATKADVYEIVKEALEPYATKEEMRAGFAYLNENIDRVLNVVVSMNNRLTPLVEDHERRLKRLEKGRGRGVMTSA